MSYTLSSILQPTCHHQNFLLLYDIFYGILALCCMLSVIAHRTHLNVQAHTTSNCHNYHWNNFCICSERCFECFAFEFLLRVYFLRFLDFAVGPTCSEMKWFETNLFYCVFVWRELLVFVLHMYLGFWVVLQSGIKRKGVLTRLIKSKPFEYIFYVVGSWIDCVSV